MEFQVATKAIIFKGDKILLLHKSADEDINPNSADIPGGRLKYGEMPLDGILREVQEETGLKIEIIGPSRTWSFIKKDKNMQLVGITFSCVYKSGEVVLSGEHTQFSWKSVTEILKETYPDWIKEEVKAASKLIKK